MKGILAIYVVAVALGAWCIHDHNWTFAFVNGTTVLLMIAVYVVHSLRGEAG